MVFTDHGLLEVDGSGARLQCGHPGDARPTDGWIPERLRWATELLEDIFRIQKKSIDGVSLQTDWLFWEVKSFDRLLQHLGVSGPIGSVLRQADSIAVEGNVIVPLTGLFDVECEIRVGDLLNYMPPDNVGIELKHWTPSVAMDDLQIEFTGEVVRQFCSASLAKMREQLDSYFPMRYE